MIPRLSIVVPTMRVGGLDVLCAGLEGQTCKDFELVLVDDIKAFRGELQSFIYPVQHLEPVGNDFPRNHYCRSANTGICAARGEVVLLLVDYTFISQRLVERHLALHDERRDRVVMSPHRSVQCPPLSSRFKPMRGAEEQYAEAGLEEYERQLRAGELHSVMWSIFDEPFNPTQCLPPEERYGGRDPKYGLSGPNDQVQLFYCRAESVKREHLWAINGFDEALDGSHAYQDSDLAERLYRQGLEFYVEPGEEAVIVNPRPYFPHARRERPIESNGAYFLARKQAGFPGEVRGIRELG